MRALRAIVNGIAGLAFAFALAWAIVELVTHLRDEDATDRNNG